MRADRQVTAPGFMRIGGAEANTQGDQPVIAK